MASRFWSALAAWLLCDVCGSRYVEHYNRGIGSVLFAGICTMTASYERVPGLPESDAGYKMNAFSLIAWPGALWGMAMFFVLSAAEAKTACLWLMLSPLLLNVLGLPILANKYILGRNPQCKWRISSGLSSLGVLIGHLVSESRLGRKVDDCIAGLLAPIGPFQTLTNIAGAAIMLLSVARMVQSHSRAAKDLQLAKRIPSETIIPFDFAPFWGLQGSLFVIRWITGLALCASAIDNPTVRASLASTSVAIVLMMAFLPPFSGKIWGYDYDNYMRVLSILHVTAVSSHCLYRKLLL